MNGILLVATKDRQVTAVCETVASLIDLDVRRHDNGREFFAALRRAGGGNDAPSIKIALVDDDLQDMCGHQLVPLIRDQYPDLKIIYMTNGTDPEIEVRVRQAGVHCVVDKPIEATLLEKLLRKTWDHETTRIHSAVRPQPKATLATGKLS